MQLLHQTPVLDLTEADIRRGYVDLPAGARLCVSTTSRNGYQIDFLPRLPFFSACTVRSAGELAELGPEGGTMECGGPSQPHDAELSFRFVLTRELRPGRYEFPFFILVRPL